MTHLWLRYGRRSALAAGLVAASLAWLPAARAQDDWAINGRHWVAAWQGSPQTFDPLLAGTTSPPPSYANQTLREIVFVTAGVAWLAWLAYRLATIVP